VFVMWFHETGKSCLTVERVFNIDAILHHSKTIRRGLA
jgi:hypothetical protein